MSASSTLKRIKWRKAYNDSVTESVTFLAKLNSIEAEIANEVDGGKDVQSTTTGQRTVSFFKGVEPQDRAAFILELQDVYTEAVRNLDTAGNSSPTDEEIKDEGEAYFVDASEAGCDFSGMRWPVSV